MTTAVHKPRSDENRARELERKWERLRNRVGQSQLPELAEILGTKDRSEEEVEEFLRRFEAGEFRNQE